jgi:hypothetical protein
MITDFGAHHINSAMWAMGKNNTGPIEFNNIRGAMPAETERYNTAIAFHFECKLAGGLGFAVADADANAMLRREWRKPWVILLRKSEVGGRKA